MNRILLSTIVLLAMILGCSKEGDTFSQQSDDPCSKFKDERMCDLMSMHAGVNRFCNWKVVAYPDKATSMMIEHRACVSAP